jgi:hypothetical protein
MVLRIQLDNPLLQKGQEIRGISESDILELETKYGYCVARCVMRVNV